MRRVLRLLVVGVLGLAASVFVASPANAEPSGPHYWMYTNDNFSPHGGKVDFYSDGDHVKLCDTRADGRRVHLLVQDADNRYTVLYYLEASGNGVCDAAHASDGGSHNLPEGHCIYFDIWLTDSGVYILGSEDTAQWANDNEFKYNCEP